MKILAVLLLLCSLGWAQLPDAPKPTTCTEKDGSPCPEWVHKLIGQYPPAPDKPFEQARDAKFFTLAPGKTIHPNKKSWALFLGAHAAAWGVMTYDIVKTHGARETWGSEAPALAGVTGMDLIAFKFICPCMSVEAPVYAMYHYGSDASK